MKQIYLFFILIGLVFVDDRSETFKRAADLCNSHKISIKFYINTNDHKAAFYDSAADVIYLNSGNSFWDNSVENHKMNRAANHFSTDNKDHIILHEIGHALLRKKIGNEKLAYHSNTHTPVSLSQQKIMEVSKYATTDIIEFFSEVFVGLKTGKEYSEEIIREYNRIWNL